jgi:hypothetical protein
MVWRQAGRDVPGAPGWVVLFRQPRYHQISRSLEVVAVTDVLIRDVPDEVVAAIEDKARRLGLSRTEFLRRQMLRVATSTEAPVTAESLQRFHQRFSELGDADVMRGAWE